MNRKIRLCKLKKKNKTISCKQILFWARNMLSVYVMYEHECSWKFEVVE